MRDIRSLEVRVVRIALLLLIWYSIGIAASDFSLGDALLGIIPLVAAGLLAFALIDNRLVKRLEERSMPGKSLIGIYGLMIILIYGGIRNLHLNDVFLLGELYLPGLIGAIQAIGTFILSAILLWETIALTRHHFASRE